MSYIEDLSDEIFSDPKDFGYGSFVSKNDFKGLALLLNDKSKARVARKVMPKDTFLSIVAQGVENLLQKDAATEKYYMTLLGIVQASTKIEFNPTTTALVNGLESDGILNSVDDILNRDGSRAEVLWGVGFHVSDLDVAKALWGDER